MICGSDTAKESDMNSRIMRVAAGLGGLLASAAFGLGIVQGAFAQTDQPVRASGQEAAQAAPAIPMEQVLAQLKAEGYGEIYEIEREHNRYEVKARDREGRRVELYLDAATGKVLQSEEDDD
jgi:Peptidase propeptide and YPEB domain